MAGFQDWSRYSSERLQNYGSDLPRQFLRSDLTEQRTGRFVADMYESTYRAEKQPIEALVKHSLGDINLRGESKGGWEHKHPSPKAQDDFDLDYQSMRKDTFGTLNF
jgi:hypothetical protein